MHSGKYALPQAETRENVLAGQKAKLLGHRPKQKKNLILSLHRGSTTKFVPIDALLWGQLEQQSYWASVCVLPYGNSFLWQTTQKTQRKKTKTISGRKWTNNQRLLYQIFYKELLSQGFSSTISSANWYLEKGEKERKRFSPLWVHRTPQRLQGADKVRNLTFGQLYIRCPASLSCCWIWSEWCPASSSTPPTTPTEGMKKVFSTPKLLQLD